MNLRHLVAYGEHHFLLETGMTKFGTPGGVWCSYTPPRYGNPGVVEMLYATKESRIHVPAILGVVAVHSLNTYGELPVGSDNLSCHSIRIQNRLAKLLGQLSVDAPINKDNWFSSLRNIRHWSTVFNSQEPRILDLELLREGKAFVLNVLKNPEAVQMELPFYQEV
jgi:hypothetical protein